MIEIWQTDAEGRYPDQQSSGKTNSNFSGFGRCDTGVDSQNKYIFETIKPGQIDTETAPHISQDGTKVERTVTGEQNLTEITNREYEYQLNELKREIYLPKTSSLPVLDEEIKNLLKYETSYKITDEGYRLPEDV